MFAPWAIVFKNFLLDTLFPRSERAERVEKEKDTPLPLHIRTRVYNGRSITVLSSYDEPRVRDALCAFKFERDLHSRDLLAALLDEFLVEHLSDTALFGERVLSVPMPLGAKRLAERGMNQVEEILKATRAIRGGQMPCVHALVRARETKPQSTLPRAERLTNVHGAFATAPAHAHALRNTTVLLIDDVTTTGATLHEAAVALEREGANVMPIALAS